MRMQKIRLQRTPAGCSMKKFMLYRSKPYKKKRIGSPSEGMRINSSKFTPLFFRWRRAKFFTFHFLRKLKFVCIQMYSGWEGVPTPQQIFNFKILTSLMDFENMEHFLRVLILFLVLIVLIAVIGKINQTWHLFDGWFRSIYCWAFGCWKLKSDILTTTDKLSFSLPYK